MPPTEYSLGELAGLGEEIFDRKVRPLLQPQDDGKFVAIDAKTSDFEIDDDDYSAITRLKNRKPMSDIWLLRAGYPAAYRIA